MKVIKRNGKEDSFDVKKIIESIDRANQELPEKDRMSPSRMRLISKEVEEVAEKNNGVIKYSQIRDLVESKIIVLGSIPLIKRYIKHGAVQSATAA